MLARFCDVGRHDHRILDRAVVGQPVAVVEQAAGGLGGPVAGAGGRRDRYRRFGAAAPAVDDANGLVERVDQLDRADHDRLERVAALRTEAGLARRLLGERGQLVVVERVAGERADDVGRASVEVGVECVGLGDVLLDGDLAELSDREGSSAAGDDRCRPRAGSRAGTAARRTPASARSRGSRTRRPAGRSRRRARAPAPAAGGSPPARSGDGMR